MGNFMINRIAADFEVKLEVNNEDKRFFYAATKGEFYHFVFYNLEIRNYGHFYVHRFEIANWLQQQIESEVDLSKIILSSENILMEYTFCKTSNKRSLAICYESEYYQIPEKALINKQMFTDAALVSEIKKEASNDNFVKNILATFLETVETNIDYSFLNKHLQALAFEQKLFKTIDDWKKKSDLYKLLKLTIVEKKNIHPFFMENLTEGIKLLHNETEEDKASPYSFFELLQEAYNAFFVANNLLSDGVFEEKNVEVAFDKVWQKLNAKQRAVLHFLDDEFGNTPLINMYLLLPNANTEHFIYKMTMPYQPDSEEEIYVKRLSNLVGFYLNED